MLHASGQASSDYISKAMIAMFNGKKQLLGPFNHLNIEGV